MATLRFSSLALCLAILSTQQALAAEESKVTADQALQQLLEGNARYVAGALVACDKTTPALRQELARGQAPKAIIVSCADSRLPPEMVFDEPPGSLFVVRVAGNTVDPLLLGSVEYAAEHLGTPLVVVLGHERCGAVTATCESGGKAPGNIGAVVKAIAPAAQRARLSASASDKAALVEITMVENVKLVVQKLTKDSKALAHLVHAGKLKVVGARYDLDDGKVTLIETAPIPAAK